MASKYYVAPAAATKSRILIYYLSKSVSKSLRFKSTDSTHPNILTIWYLKASTEFIQDSAIPGEVGFFSHNQQHWPAVCPEPGLSVLAYCFRTPTIPILIHFWTIKR